MTDTISLLLPLFAGAPLLVGGILLALPRQHVLRSVLGMGSLIAMLAGAVILVVLTADGTVIAHQVALWPGGVAIPFVADLFASLVLTVTAILAVVSFQYMIASGEARSPSIASLVLILAGGVAGALLTGDLFNLFVFIEVMLLPSYGLLLILSRRADMGGARLYVTVNLLASSLFLAGVALIYAVEGTVNLAELAGAAVDEPATAIAAAVCLAAIAVKAAVFPVHGWLARTYVVASPAVTALFSGLHTKVAIYVIYRVYSVVFDGDATWLVIALVITCLTMVIGVFGAMGEPTMRSILVFHMVSQIGYILVGVGLFTQLGLTAGIFYLLHHMIVKASLFLSTGAIEQTYGSGRLEKLGGLRTREPLITAAFVVAALSLAGCITNPLGSGSDESTIPDRQAITLPPAPPRRSACATSVARLAGPKRKATRRSASAHTSRPSFCGRYPSSGSRETSLKAAGRLTADISALDCPLEAGSAFAPRSWLDVQPSDRRVLDIS